MPRVNLDEEFFVDPRIEKLARLCKEIRALTRGRLVAIYHHCYITRNPYKTAEEIDRYGDWDGEESYAELMVRAGLAQPEINGLYRVGGVEKRVAYLKKQAEYGKLSAKIRNIKHGTSQPIRHPKSPKVPSAEISDSSEPTFETSRRYRENTLCITPKLPSETSKLPSDRSEHILSSIHITPKAIPKLRARLTNEEIEIMKREALRRDEESRQLRAPSDGLPSGPTEGLS